jgi:sensor histidine kinase YesM
VVRSIIFIFIVWCITWQLHAQQSVLVSDILKHKNIYLDSTFFTKSNLNIPLPDFVTYFNYKKSISIVVENDLDIDFSFYFYIGSTDLLKQHSVDVVRSRSGVNGLIVSQEDTSLLSYNGFLVPVKERNKHRHIQVFEYHILAKSSKLIQLHFFDLPNRKAQLEVRVLHPESLIDVLEQQAKAKSNSAFLSNIYVGGILMMFCFTMAIYAQNKQTDFLFYALYLIFVLLFGILDVFPLHFQDWTIWNYPTHWIYAKETVAYVYLICYHSFLIEFLDLKRNQPSLYKLLYYINLFFGVLFVLNLISLLVPFSVSVLYWLIYLNSFVFYSLFVFYWYLFWKLWFIRGVAFSRYIFWGSFVFYWGNVLGIIFGNFSSLAKPFFPNNFIQMGTMIEILFFALGLGRKALQDSEEKNKLQKQVILQLEEKKQLIEDINERLEKEVTEKTEEILAQTQILQAEKEEKMRLQFHQQIQELRLYTIQTQLNPHFLFNCLNTIKSFIINNQNDKASLYLHQFAVLMRSTLENSEKLKINLKETIAYLSNYVSMEKLRFQEDFEFEIRFEGEEDPELLQVPPMLIQPFIENAIIHGLVPSDKQKKLTVLFIEEEDFLICKVIDNGKGFQNSEKKTKHQSKGLLMIQNYFELWNVQKHEKASFKIHSEENIGTEVHIQIPI